MTYSRILLAETVKDKHFFISRGIINYTNSLLKTYILSKL